jgi:hypothetical protein
VEERAACAACLAVHHGDCWARDAKCAACGAHEILTRPTPTKGGAPVGHGAPRLTDIVRATPRLRARFDRLALLLGLSFLLVPLGLFTAPLLAAFGGFLLVVVLVVEQLVVTFPAWRLRRRMRR